MSTLLLPVAGRSSRFPNMRPKWLLTMPDGKLMLEKSVEKIDLNFFSKIVIICLKEHLDSFASEKTILDSFKAATGKDAIIFSLEKTTSSQSETIYNVLKTMNIKDHVFIKDCDNCFSVDLDKSNYISIIDLNKIDFVDAKNKSYIETDSLGNVTNIVEKKVISDKFCCGGYSFESAAEFIETYEGIVSDEEVYVSHIIFNMLLKKKSFMYKEASNYIDWGTLREYRQYCSQFKTIFCDVDGVLLRNGSKFVTGGWKTKAIEENLIKLKKLQAKGFLYLVLTSSRPESEIKYTIDELAKNGLKVDKCLFGLPHSRRTLINDFSPTNPYPSAIALNIERNANNLSEIL